MINALAYAETLLPAEAIWVHLVIFIEQSADYAPNPRAYLALQGRILRRLSEWLHYRNLPAHFIWTREIQPRYEKAHSHLLMPLPLEYRDEVKALIYKVGRLQDTSNNWAVYVSSNHGRGINTPASRAGVLRDFLKTMSPKAVFRGMLIMPALEVDNRKQKPCTILGKRSGVSESLGPKARMAAGWIELNTLAELRAALPTKQDGEKERKRLKQRRYRARRKVNTGNLPSPRPIRAPRPEPLPDLAADFFD